MYQQERILKIRERLNEKESLDNAEIQELLGVSRDTARRDIVKMVEDGYALRTHGGIMLPQSHNRVLGYEKRLPIHLDAKRAIARQTAKSVDMVGVCFFHVSTTIEELCDYVPHGGIVYTTSWDTLDRLSKRNRDVRLVGGKFNRNNRFFYGTEVLTQLDRIRFDHVFLGAAAIHEDGIYYEDAEDAAVVQLVVSRTTSAAVLTDSSKFHKTSRFRGVSFPEFTTLFTDAAPSTTLAGQLDSAGVTIDIVEESK